MKILIVDDHPLIRDALREHLQQLQKGVVLIEAESSAEALELAAKNPDLNFVLLDLNLPDAHGFSTLLALREHHETVPVVVLSASDDREMVLEALDRGAMGFIPKTVKADVMLGALRLVLSGGVYLPQNILQTWSTPAVVASGAHQYPPASAATPEDVGLSNRQAQVLAMIVEGKPNKAICRELGLAESTVKFHVGCILKALNVSNRTQAVIAVGRLGLRLGLASGPKTGSCK